MELPLYQIDAFTGEGLAGNPAAVCPLHDWLDDGLMQRIAEENNLSETAFFIRRGPDRRLRWFTPSTEVELCGHATLASAYTIWEHLGGTEPEIMFRTRSGELVARREGHQVAIELPAAPAHPVDEALTEATWRALGRRGEAVLQANYLMAVLPDEAAVRAVRPDLEAVAALPATALIVTAPGERSDIVSRFFAPALGVPEDPVTGSAHCALAPYWSVRLGKPDLHAVQLSRRGGEMLCRTEGGRVMLAGRARTYLKGTIYV